MRAQVNWDEVHPNVREAVKNFSAVSGNVSEFVKVSGKMRVAVDFHHDNNGNFVNQRFWFDVDAVRVSVN